MGFPGIFPSGARVEPDGFAGMCYCQDTASDSDGWTQFSGDVGLGLWGNLMAARCYVVHDPVMGPAAYGGVLTGSLEKNCLVEPYPGMDHRVRFIEPDLFIDTQGASIRSVEWNREKGVVTLQLVNDTEYPSKGSVSIRGLDAGDYRVVWNPGRKGAKTRVEKRSVTKQPVTIDRAFGAGERSALEMQQAFLHEYPGMQTRQHLP